MKRIFKRVLMGLGGLLLVLLLVGVTYEQVSRRAFEATRPPDEAFVDVSPTDLLTGSPEVLRDSFAVPPHGLVALGVHTGLIRAVFSFAPFVSSLPVDHWFNRHVRDSFSTSWKGILDAAKEDDPWFEQAGRITSFGDLPLVVISATYPNGVDALPDEPEVTMAFLEYNRSAAEALLDLSPNSRLVLATQSDHYVQLHEPGLVLGAITSLLETPRGEAPTAEGE